MMKIGRKWVQVALVLGLLTTVAQPLWAEQLHLRWHNGDVLPGELLASEPGQVRWSSPQFDDDLVLNTDVLDSITFDQQPTQPKGSLRIGTITGDVFTADLIGSDQRSFLFSTRRYGELRVLRDAIYSLARREHPDLIFDGSQLENWELARNGPIKDMTYRIYRGRLERGAVDFAGLTPAGEGSLSAGWLDIGLAEFNDEFAIIFEGFIEAELPGDYSFELFSDDGSRLSIDGQELTTHGFGQAFKSNSQTTLTAGRHSIRVEYYELVGDEQLGAWWTGPDLAITRLSGTNEGSGWHRGNGSHPETRRKQTGIFREIAVPAQFEVELALHSSSSPRFAMAFGESVSSATSDRSLRLETWDDEVVVIQGNVFEPVMTIEEGQNDILLRLTIDGPAGVLQVFDASGRSLVVVNGIEATTGSSGVLIRNRGDDLTVRRLSVYHRSTAAARQATDFTRPRVHLTNGDVIYGRLSVTKGGAYVVDGNRKRRRIDLTQLERIARPDARLRVTPGSSELSYTDGEVIYGQIQSMDSAQVVLRTAFSEAPVTCALAGASSLHFPSSPTSEPTGTEGDELFSASGRLRGRLVFGGNASPLSWLPHGATKPLQFSLDGDARVERGRSSLPQSRSFDGAAFPSVLHLVNGEIIPTRISAYEDDTLSHQSPFINGRTLASVVIKAIEFTPLEEPVDAHPDGLDDWLGKLLAPAEDGSDVTPAALEHALTVPRANRDSPPEHILVANNGDLKRGKLVAITGKSVRFQSKLREFTVPISRIARVVRVSDPETSEPDAAPPAAEIDTVRAFLVDGAILTFVPTVAKDGRLHGRSSVYGGVSIPTDTIKELILGHYETDAIGSPFGHWVVRPAREPEFGDP